MTTPMGPPPEGFDPTAGGPQQFPGSPGYPPQAPAGYPPQAPAGYPPQAPPGYPPQAPPGYPPQAPPGYPPQAPPGYPPQAAPKKKMSTGAIVGIVVAVGFVGLLVFAILVAIAIPTYLGARARALENQRQAQLRQSGQSSQGRDGTDANSAGWGSTGNGDSSLPQEQRDAAAVMVASHKAALRMGPDSSSPFEGLSTERMAKLVPSVTYVDGTTDSTSFGTVSIETKSPIRLVMATKGPSGTCYFVRDDAGKVSLNDVPDAASCRAADPPEPGWRPADIG